MGYKPRPLLFVINPKAHKNQTSVPSAELSVSPSYASHDFSDKLIPGIQISLSRDLWFWRELGWTRNFCVRVSIFSRIYIVTSVDYKHFNE